MERNPAYQFTTSNSLMELLEATFMQYNQARQSLALGNLFVMSVASREAQLRRGE